MNVSTGPRQRYDKYVKKMEQRNIFYVDFLICLLSTAIPFAFYYISMGQNSCEDRIEKSVPRDHRLSSHGMPRDAKIALHGKPCDSKW